MTTPEDDSGGRPYIPPRPDLDDIVIRSADGTVLRQVALPPLHNVEASMSRMHEAFARMAEMLEAVPWYEVPRGGFAFEYRLPGGDPRQGEEVSVHFLTPGARVYVLEDVFTVDRVDMNAILPTVWLKELPTSPLYFSDEESIYLANETED
jgi:hypothetical protein